MLGRRQAPEDRKILILKLLIDKASNRVIFAESDSDFVDTLFSILTLPLGTIVRLLGPGSLSIGSINLLYRSVTAAKPHHLQTAFCKEMLLNPRNAAETLCSNLKININQQEPLQFFSCGLWGCGYLNHFSTFKNARCGNGHQMDGRAVVDDGCKRPEGVCGNDEVFVKGSATRFMITDDLQVMPGSTASCILLLNKLGITDGQGVEERNVEIKEDEVTRLLKFSLISKSPLTEAFLPNQGSTMADPVEPEQKKSAQNKKTAAANSNSFCLKLLIGKTKKRVLYAEAGVDVVDFLFSFLTFPLGSIVKILCKNSSLGCMDNLYKSVEELSTANYIKSEECNEMLISPKIAPLFSCENQPLQIEVASYPQYLYNGNGRLRLATDADAKPADENGCLATIMDPKCPTGTHKGKGFTKGPAVFMITDNLTVTPLSPISSITILNHLNVAITDVEERMVTMGNDEALKLLKASLLSKTPLSDVFYQRKPYPEVMLKV